jgi:outer membrane protein OmpA-like peptidoglycan-associated protein
LSKTFRIVILFLFAAHTLLGQTLRKAGDCPNAIEFDAKRFSGLIPPPKGYGEEKEIKGFDLKNKHFFTEEHNTYWFYVIFDYDTEFEMILTPEYAEDDYDFLLFIDTIPDFCQQIKEKKFYPVRTNMSRVNPEEGSVTGLKKGYENEYAMAGKSEPYSKPLYAKKNQKYYVVIDCPYGCEGGFYLNFYYNGQNEQGETLDDRQSRIKQKRLSEGRRTQTRQMRIEFYSKEDSTQLRDVDFFIEGMLPEDKLIKTGDIHTVRPVHHFRTYRVRADKKGYKQEQRNYTHTIDKDTVLRVYLEKLKTGTKLTFSNIHFAGDRADILSSSLKDLEDLKNFLINNPNISVEVMGHVNGVGNKTKKHKKLSTARAKAVYNYLIAYGIEKERLTYKGYGGDMMIYPEPMNEYQSQMNRRVEVRVTAIK